ncbi:peptide/nickel transport system substrate-binding protein [Bibersteinia trehalosi]|uniref:ABC transporter substrate-binding protein n=1 Tax=Bibersteinia trehalosi TaxID=47735 RepID=UPI00104F7F45|nr:ABC transporter substrate-binding protein [Bibersteinia trehalosi]TCT13916.1 peptide/nickel transport system substrate-binding protein [Bibersteinia trehalosi]
MQKILFPFIFSSLLLSACDQQTAQTTIVQAESQTASPTQNNELTLATIVAPWEIGNLEPNQSGVIFQRMNLAETLVEADQQGNLIPALATEWHSDESGKIWTFSLRENVSFHNGKSLDVQAVVNSLNIAKSKPGVLANAFISEIRANNDKVEIELSKAFEPFPSFLTHYSTIILAPESYNNEGNVVELIGTGAFKPVQIQAPQKLSAQRFDAYWGEKPLLLQANYLASSRSETRSLMAQSDASSLVFNLDTASVERLKNDPNLQVISGSIARTIQLKMDVAKPFFNDIAIRQALSQAINRKAIAEQVLKIEDGIADQLLPKGFEEWRVQSEIPAVDIAKIKQNLTAYGYEFDAQGNLTKDGKPFSFTLRTFSDRPELPIIATILQAQWKQIGVNVNVSVGNFSEIPAGHQDGSLEMALYAFNYGKTLDPFAIIAQDIANGGSDWGVMNWQNSELDNAVKALETERSPEKAKALKQQISQIINDELPIIPVVYYQQNVVAHKGVQNITLDPFERHFFLEKLAK